MKIQYFLIKYYMTIFDYYPLLIRTRTRYCIYLNKLHLKFAEIKHIVKTGPFSVASCSSEHYCGYKKQHPFLDLILIDLFRHSFHT